MDITLPSFFDAEKGYKLEDHREAYNAPRKVKLLIDGPYGFNLHQASDFETIMLVAGGSGVGQSR